MEIKLTENIKYIGVDDKKIDLFESQYIVPNGISYNSYLIEDEKTAIMDTVDKRAVKEWMKKLDETIQNKKVDYLIVSHLEPDHSSGIETLVEKYPNIKIVLSKKAMDMLPQFANKEITEKCISVKEGEELNLGKHKLKFMMAPMVHWPEVMFTYEQTEKVLFTADAFGKFGTLDTEQEWACEARRYYFNIVGKYGMQVQAILKKSLALEINMICPLHGPILKEKLDYYIEKYNIWSSYEPEEKGVLIAYNSIYGNTKKAAEKMAERLKEKSEEKVIISDLARIDMAEVIEDAFKYDKLIIMSPTYDGGLFPTTETFLRLLKHKNYQNRKVGIIENGSWAPMAAKHIQDILREMKNITIAEPIISIKTKMNEDVIEKIEELVKAM